MSPGLKYAHSPRPVRLCGRMNKELAEGVDAQHSLVTTDKWKMIKENQNHGKKLYWNLFPTLFIYICMSSSMSISVCLIWFCVRFTCDIRHFLWSVCVCVNEFYVVFLYVDYVCMCGL